MDIGALQEICLPDTGGHTHRLGDLFAHRQIVLVFARHFG
jgi:hypothetical protein